MDELLLLVGSITVTWAMLERALDLSIHTLFYRWGASEHVSEIPRTALNRKIEFLRAVFKPGTLLDTLFPGMPRVANDIEALGNHRHQYVHGAASFVFSDDGSSTFKRLMRLKDGTLTDTIATVTPEHLTELRNEIHSMAVFVAEFAAILDKHAAGDGPDEAHGEGAV